MKDKVRYCFVGLILSRIGSVILTIVQSYTCIVNKKFSMILILFVGLATLFTLAYKEQIKFIVNFQIMSI